MKEKDKEERPFSIILGKELQEFLKNIKDHLKVFMDSEIDEEDKYEDEIKERLIIQAIYQLPVYELNLYLIKLFGNYKSTTELADELHITKQTLCNKMRNIKTYIKKYVDANIDQFINN